MNAETRAAVIREFLETECLPLLETKGSEYSGKDDSLANFKIIGTLVQWALSQGGYNVPARTCAGLALMVYKLKHVMAELTYIVSGQEGAEPIPGRIADDANYALLLHCLIRDFKENPND